MYIAVNKISNNKAVIERFKQAAPDMKRFTGFLGLEIWEGNDGSMQAISRWTSKEALDEYTNNQVFQRHHSSSGEAQSSGHAQTVYYTGEVII